MLDIESFIEQSRGAGQLESEGSFDVDSFGALRKTLSSSLPEYHYCLFQIVQGLVRAGVKDIKIAIGRQGTKFSFLDVNGAFKDRDDLLARLNGTLSLSTNKAKGLLVSGIATALGSDVTVATLWGGNTDKALRLAIDEASVVDSQSSPEFTFLELRRASTKHLTFNWSRIWGARKEEFRLRKRFEQSPSRLNIAGLKTSPSTLWRREVPPAGCAGPVVLLEAVVLAEDRANHCGEDPGWVLPLENRVDLYGNSPVEPDFEAPHESDEDEDAEQEAENLFLLALDQNGDPITAPVDKGRWSQRLTTLSFTSGQESFVYFVRNGCLYGPYQRDLGFAGLRAILPGDDLRVDATGYALVENEKFEQRLESAAQLAQKASGCLSLEDLKAYYKVIRPSRNAEAEISSLADTFSWLS